MIVFLGWGSLIWKPGNLQLKGPWNDDGPFLPIEYARISRNGRLTLVLCSGVSDVQTLWAYSGHDGLSHSVDALAKRERTGPSRIGYMSIPDNLDRCRAVPDVLPRIRSWAEQKGIDVVVWTDLPTNFEEKTGKVFSGEAVIEYLKSLKGETLQKARKYVEKTPPQIDTRIRRRIGHELGW